MISVIIPCRNEYGNIQACVDRIMFPAEIVFVEGGSSDRTWEAIMDLRGRFVNRENIRAFHQPGRGKFDAVRYGISKATGDYIIIMDADLTVAPEDMSLFMEALDKTLSFTGQGLG